VFYRIGRESHGPAPSPSLAFECRASGVRRSAPGKTQTCAPRLHRLRPANGEREVSVGMLPEIQQQAGESQKNWREPEEVSLEL
jgi:hypothetical protein